ncbi:hypothetical protein, partial [Mesorhizobium sp.]|uniref:hypothetical protein n=1 Tax=Mesorhizobium sp. TaxID=1871066 RepID=UPI0025F19994
LAKQQNRRTHAVELRHLNGFSLSLTKHRIKCKEERERTYRNQSDEPFRAGVDDPDQLAEELEQVG